MKLFILILSICSVSLAEYAKSYVLSEPNDKRVKVAVIDTGIRITKEVEPYLCLGKHYDLTNTGIQDDHGHGTNIAGIIASKINSLTTCIVVIKYFDNGRNSLQRELEALRIASNLPNIKFINFSSGGQDRSYDERLAIQEIVNKKIYFVTAAGNNSWELGINVCNYFPACYRFLNKYFRVVGNGENPIKRAKTSNYGQVVTDWRQGMQVNGFGITMSGTSQSAAILTSELASERQ